MEQVFVIIAVVIFWIFKGVAGAQRRVPGEDPYDSEPLGGPIDIPGTARQKTLESQQRALEALQRWEEKQRLSGGYGGPAREGPEAIPAAVPAASRTRVGRPATSTQRAAARQRKEAFADIARMLDPAQAAGATSAQRSGREVSSPASRPPDREAPRRVSDRRPSDAAIRREAEHQVEEARRTEAAQEAAADAKAGKTAGAAPPSGLARLEALPLAARAIVYGEILGRPRSLS
jgi:hypothetical protein